MWRNAGIGQGWSVLLWRCQQLNLELRSVHVPYPCCLHLQNWPVLRGRDVAVHVFSFRNSWIVCVGVGGGLLLWFGLGSWSVVGFVSEMQVLPVLRCNDCKSYVWLWGTWITGNHLYFDNIFKQMLTSLLVVGRFYICLPQLNWAV